MGGPPPVELVRGRRCHGSLLSHPADTKRKVEEISEELKTLDTRLWSERDAEKPPQPPEEARGDGNRRPPHAWGHPGWAAATSAWW